MHKQLCRGYPVVLALWLALGSTGARADDPKSDAKKQMHKGEHQEGEQHRPKGPMSSEAMKPTEQTGKHEGHEHMKEARQARAEAKTVEPVAPERGAATPEATQNSEPAGERTRAERGKQERTRAWLALKRHFGKPQEIPADIRNELQHHARRVARLQRIQMLAQAAGDQKALARVEALLARENQRHDKKLETQASAQAKTSANDDKETAANSAAAPAAANKGAEP